MIDVHCHLNFKSFIDDYDDVIREAIEAGITHIINVGTKIESSKKAIDLALKYDNLYAIVGIHPHHADKLELETNWLEQLNDLATKPKVIAIGEIGLDYFPYKSNGIVDKILQKRYLKSKLKLPSSIGCHYKFTTGMQAMIF